MITSGQYILSLVLAFFIGAFCGFGFWFVSGFRKESKQLVAAGVVSAFAGWVVGQLFPLHEYKAIGVLGFTAIFAFDGSFIWWARLQSRP